PPARSGLPRARPMPLAGPGALALLSAHATACHSMPYSVSLPAALCAWHMLPHSCVRTPTIPQVTHAVDKIVGSAFRRVWLAKKKPGLRTTMNRIHRRAERLERGTPETI